MNYSSFFRLIVSIGFCFALFYCSDTKGQTLPNPEIKEGIATLSGKITNLHPVRKTDNLKLTLIVPYLINTENFSYPTTVNEDGIFSFEVPMQCNYAIGYIRMNFYDYDGFNVCLASGKETKIELVYDETARLKIVDQIDSLGLTSTDLFNINRVLNRSIISHPPGFTGYFKTPDEFMKRAKITLNYRLKIIEENNALSEIAKHYIANNVKIHTLDWRLLRNREIMQIYSNAGNEDVAFLNFHEPKKYYAFLKDFDLNNPQYLYQAHYLEVLNMILSNETLNIPPIGDTPVDQWMKKTRKILSKLVGFDKGLFYDLLAANSYAQQFNDKLKPLSDKQIKNINHYFKGEKEEIAKILLKK